MTAKIYKFEEKVKKFRKSGVYKLLNNLKTTTDLNEEVSTITKKIRLPYHTKRLTNSSEKGRTLKPLKKYKNPVN